MRRLLPLITGIVFLSTASAASASLMYFGAPAEPIGDGPVAIGVFLDAQGHAFNAVEGEITLNGAAVTAVHEGAGRISQWVEAPGVPSCDPDCTMRFAGVIPGGFAASDALLFTFEAKAAGTEPFTVSAQSVRVLANDGEGTELPVRVAPLTLKTAVGLPSAPELEDRNPPELFLPVVASDPNVFEGRPFAAFSARDPESGIDHYEIREYRRPWLWKGNWRVATSPVELRDDSGRSFVDVKAVDRAGNARVETMQPLNSVAWYQDPLIWGILLLVALIVALILWRNRHAHAAVSARSSRPSRRSRS